MTMQYLRDSLINRGWKPFDQDVKKLYRDEHGFIFYRDTDCNDGTPCDNSLRDMVSIESGLRQFVCSNRLHGKSNDERLIIDEVEYDSHTMQYRIARSSIQTDIEKFLLDNIKF